MTHNLSPIWDTPVDTFTVCGLVVVLNVSDDNGGWRETHQLTGFAVYADDTLEPMIRYHGRELLLSAYTRTQWRPGRGRRYRYGYWTASADEVPADDERVMTGPGR